MGYVLAGLLLLLVIWKGATSTLLKDFSDAGAAAPYSFSRSQLIWWTTIIGICIALHFQLCGDFPSFVNDSTTLILLGISASTSGAATILDLRQDAASSKSGIPRSQDSPTQGWLTDVLSDNNGISVHRFQALVFNGLYGVLYLVKFFSNIRHDLPQFDQGTLGLLGISAATYGLMKGTENQGQIPPPPVTTAAPSNDSGWVG